MDQAPPDIYELCFQRSPWPSLLVNPETGQLLAANCAWQQLSLASETWSAALQLEERLTELQTPLLSTGCLQLSTKTLNCPCLLVPLTPKSLLIQCQLSEQHEQISHLQTLNNRKSELIANISHELRTPLTAILGWPEILLDAQDMPGLAIQAAQAIRRDGIFLRQLLEDLIDLSKIEAGYLRLKLAVEDFSLLIEKAVEMLEERLQWKKLRLHVQVPTEPVWIQVDETRMIQVILNYLSNAIKYTPSGGEILIRLEVSTQEAILSIQDNGIGMSEELRQKVFERYTRAEDLESIEGAGIGLALVKKLVGLHQGRCWVESQKNQGSRFFVALPTLLEPPIEPQPLVQKLPPLNFMNEDLALISEDNDELQLLEMLLSPFFRNIHRFRSLPTAEVIQTLRVKLLLLSTTLENQSHHAWLKAFKQANSFTRVLALTTSAMQGDQEKLQVLGFDGVMVKPFIKEDLLQYIQLMLMEKVDV